MRMMVSIFTRSLEILRTLLVGKPRTATLAGTLDSTRLTAKGHLMNRMMLAFLSIAGVGSIVAENASTQMGFNHLGAEFGAYDLDASGGIQMGGVKKGGNRLGYPLGGSWRMALDPEKKGVKEGWFTRLPGESVIALPGTLDLAGIGEPGKPSLHASFG